MAREQRLVFGSVAAAYDAHRPGYPDAMYDAILSRTVEDPCVLDIGCGTGKVAAALAAREIGGIAVEPDPEMAEVARARLAGSGWTVQVSDFEFCDVEPQSVDLITCGQAWHWIDPAVGLARARELLRGGGWLALFWNRPSWPDRALREAMDEVYEAIVPDMDSSIASTGSPSKGVPPTTEALDGFDLARSDEFHHTIRYTTQEWIAVLGTHSNHVLLEPEVRERLYEAEADVIDSHGGAMDVNYRVELWSYRRAVTG